MAKKCPKCHSENTDTARFCSNCATSLSDTRKPEPLTELDLGQAEYSHRLPFCPPGGRNVLFTITRTMTDIEPRIAIREGTTRKWRVLVENASDARCIPSGYTAFMRRGTLMAVPFDLAKFDVRGQPTPVIPEVLQMLNSAKSACNTAAAQYAISDSGSLVYVRGGIIPNMKNSLVWFDRNGNEKSISSRLKPYLAPRLSPDGRKVVYVTIGTDRFISLYDIERDNSTPSISKGPCLWPIWTPNGNGISFSWLDLLPPENINIQSADGSTAAERLTTSNYSQQASSFSPDGSQLAFVESMDSNDILIYNFQTKDTPAFAATEHDAEYPEYSPDGRWLAYCTDQEGRLEVYVRSSTGVGETVKVSREGGSEPIWARSGKQ